jgi:mannose/fructose/N-acetylgalactosamine-specific phosphotransferase system component IIC
MSNLFTALLIGFLGLDTTIAFQVLISQPIFACSIFGWLLGNAPLGIEIGIMMQLIWLNILPVGASVFLEGNIASMITCVIVIKFDSLGLPNLVFTVALAIGFLVSYVGARLTVLDRKLNVFILNWTLQAVDQANFKKITLLDFISILAYFIMMSALAYISILLAELIFPFLQEIFPPENDDKLAFVKPAAWGIGIALTTLMITQIIKSRK